MIIIFRKDATEQEIKSAVEKIESLGYKPHLSRGTVKSICGVTGDDRALLESEFDQLPGVESVLRVLKPYKLASREFHPDPTAIAVTGVMIGPGPEVHPRRRLQAALLPLRVPRPRRKGPPDHSRRGGKARASRGDGDHVRA
jgi:hypothetical protein